MELPADSRLEAEIDIEAPEPETQSVTFEASDFGHLVSKTSALGL